MEKPTWDKGSSMWRNCSTSQVEDYIQLLETRIIELGEEIQEIETRERERARLTDLWARGASVISEDEETDSDSDNEDLTEVLGAMTIEDAADAEGLTNVFV